VSLFDHSGAGAREKRLLAAGDISGFSGASFEFSHFSGEFCRFPEGANPPKPLNSFG